MAKRLTVMAGIGILGGGLLLGGCARTSLPRQDPLAADVTESPWSFGDVRGVKLASEHYRIFTTSSNRQTIVFLPAWMERSYRNYLSLTGLPERELDRPLVMYVLADRPQWALMTRQTTGPAAEIYLAIESGGYCHAGICVLWEMGNATFPLAAHEGVHQFLCRRLDESLPAWAEEGLATLAEGYRLDDQVLLPDPAANAIRRSTLRQTLTDDVLLPLRTLLTADVAETIVTSPATSPQYYAQLWAMMLYIRSEPVWRGGLERMVADAEAGVLRAELNIPPAMGQGAAFNRSAAVPIFQHYITGDLDAFEKGYRLYARKLADLDKPHWGNP